MRIYQLVIFPLQGSGSGVYADKLAEFLHRRGHQVEVLCTDHQPPHRAYPVEAVLFSNGQNQQFDLDFNFPAFTTHPASRETTFGTLTESQRQAYAQVFRQKIERGIAHLQPNIVHVHHGWVLASILAEMSAPYVISLHGTEHLGFERYAGYRALALRGLGNARRVIALTRENREQAIATYDLDPERVVVVRSGVDTDVFKPLAVDKSWLKSYNIEAQDRPVVFFGGKLTAVKGVDVLLQAAHAYSRIAGRPITLIAGEGDVRQELERQAQELDLDSVYFLGHQGQEQMVRLFNVADVAVVPSRTDYFPLVAMEALACGTPLIASNVGGLSHIVNDQVGSVVEPGDPIALAEEITTFIQARFKAKAREAAAAHIRKNFNWENTVSSIERVYDAALAQPQKVGGR
jgi:glycosyltransferase involved in cell wall biosynthesis